MTETLCFLGLTTVRVGARVLAFLQFWLQFFYLMLLIIRYIVQWDVQTETDHNDVADGKNNQTNSAYNELDFDITQYSQMTGTVLIMYSSFYLQKATYTHSLQCINFWLILNSVNFISLVAFIITASLRIGRFDIFFTGLIGCLWESYKLFVVYQFYADETATDTVNDSQRTATQNHPTDLDRPPQNEIVEYRTSTRMNDLQY